MDITTVVTSWGISVATATWLARALVINRLNKDLAEHRYKLQMQLNAEKAAIDGEIKERIETSLGDRAAEREYSLEARKRLYHLIGPLRFQLLVACRDISRRIEEHGRRDNYSMQPTNYYGRSTLYRLLRPLAISELVEYHIADVDFAVDSAAIDLLIFKRSAFRIMTGAGAIANHPDADWKRQSQHMFYESLTHAVQSLIEKDEKQGYRVMRFEAFNELMTSGLQNPGLLALSEILKDFTIESKPIFWLRLVAYAYVCREYLRVHGVPLRFGYRPLPVSSLLQKSNDAFIHNNFAKCESAIAKSVLDSL